MLDGVRVFQAWGGTINMHVWYNEGCSICQPCFMDGSEEVVLVDLQAQVRVFSLAVVDEK